MGESDKRTIVTGSRRQKRSATNPRPRLSDVAKLAGVSLGSASRALSTPELVKPKTLEAVRAAAEQLSYVIDGAARSLALRQSFTVGAILPTINNPIFADFIQGLQQHLSESNYSLLVSAHEYSSEMEVLIVERMLQRGVDGLILMGTEHDARVINHVVRGETPHLFAWSYEDGNSRSVGFSNRRAMQQVAYHLITLGHRDIAVISGHLANNERARARLEGVIDAMLLAGLELPAANIFYGDFTVEAGRQGLRAMLALDPRPTALICATDLMAAGALSETQLLGVRVPEDLSITGFDNIDFACLTTPQLTTVDVPGEEIGRQAGLAILAAINGESMGAIALPTRLVIRNSTGPAK
jgi:LacI family transcriptional regulator